MGNGGGWNLKLEEQDLVWQNRAACSGEDPDLFFPMRASHKEDAERLAAAKSICAICPVREECLEYALAMNMQFGIWGGVSEKQRKKMRSARGRQYFPHL